MVRRVIEPATAYGRYEYPIIAGMLHAEGWRVNHKRVERIWRRQGNSLWTTHPSERVSSAGLSCAILVVPPSLVVRVGDVRDVRIPAVATSTAARRMVSVRRAGNAIGWLETMHRRGRKTTEHRRRLVDEVRGEANRQIRWHVIAVEVLSDKPVLLGRQPVTHARRTPGNGDDPLQHAHRLKITRIEPAKGRLAVHHGLQGNESSHRLHPLGMLAQHETTLIRRPDAREPVRAPMGVAIMTDSALQRSEPRPGQTATRRQPPAVARHLRRPREATRDLPRPPRREAPSGSPKKSRRRPVESLAADANPVRPHPAPERRGATRTLN